MRWVAAGEHDDDATAVVDDEEPPAQGVALPPMGQDPALAASPLSLVESLAPQAASRPVPSTATSRNRWGKCMTAGW